MKTYKKIIIGVLMSMLSLTPLNATVVNSASDISEAAFIEQLKVIDTKGRLEGIEASSSKSLTREAAAKYLVQALGYEDIALIYEGNTAFKDVTSSRGEIAIINQLGVMNGTGASQFSPNQKLSRKSAETIVAGLSSKINAPTKWNHVNYAISSNSHIEQLNQYNAVSFGWAELSIDQGGTGFKLKTNGSSGDFYIPKNFEVPVDVAKLAGAETYLMVYLSNSGELAYNLLSDANQRQALVNELVNICSNISRDGQTRSLDGLTIDFEQLKNENLKVPYVTFLKELKVALAKDNKKLNVAVQPTNYLKGYDYKGIGEAADHVILMAHDYATKRLTSEEQANGICMTPVTPINKVYETLREASLAIKDKSKIVLQISFDSRQWQLKDGKVIHTSAYTPSYDKIEKRLLEPTTLKNYSELYQNPYATYTQEGIKNVIWYENTKSIQAKMTLAKLLDIQNVSYWRLGTISYLE